jgi:hypothetical protein
VSDSPSEGSNPPADPPAETVRKATPQKVLVILVGGYDDGKRRYFPREQAERFIRLGHARRP